MLDFHVALDDADTPRDVLDALMLAAFTTGEQPFAHTARLPKVRKDAELLPDSGEVRWTATDNGVRSHLVKGDGWTLRATRWKGHSADVTVTAISDELASRILKEAIKGAKDKEKPVDAVDMGFWHLTKNRGASRDNRRIATPAWTEIRRNYAAEAAVAIDRLIAVTPHTVHGRLLLLHGAPGTGKTTALRALARDWSDWCEVDCVLDPENLFHDSGYLMEVAVGDEDNAKKWRLLLIEDCDELISSGAKQASGQALSRLLNLTDGLLAQGRNVLVGLTTNEPLSRLHPAVVRPGRCLAQIEVGRLSMAEASSWLGTSAGIDVHGATLAELFALRRGETTPVPVEKTGLYL